MSKAHTRRAIKNAKLVPLKYRKEALQQLEHGNIVKVDHNDIWYKDPRTYHIVGYNYNNKTYHNHDTNRWLIPNSSVK